jgi:hypothetical protein
LRSPALFESLEGGEAMLSMRVEVEEEESPETGGEDMTRDIDAAADHYYVLPGETITFVQPSGHRIVVHGGVPPLLFSARNRVRIFLWPLIKRFYDERC